MTLAAESAGAPDPKLVAISDRPGAIRRAGEVWEYRELLGNLVRKELKVKYKNSVLGFVWSLLNPALYLVVFSLVFQVILKSAIPYYAIFLLSGCSPGTSSPTASRRRHRSISGNAAARAEGLVPARDPAARVDRRRARALLPAVRRAGRRAAACSGGRRRWSTCPLLSPRSSSLLIFVVSAGDRLSAINVYLRDTEHLLELVLLAWFWLTPIVYPYQQVADELDRLRNG